MVLWSHHRDVRLRCIKTTDRTPHHCSGRYAGALPSVKVESWSATRSRRVTHGGLSDGRSNCHRYRQLTTAQYTGDTQKRLWVFNWRSDCRWVGPPRRSSAPPPWPPWICGHRLCSTQTVLLNCARRDEGSAASTQHWNRRASTGLGGSHGNATKAIRSEDHRRGVRVHGSLSLAT